MFSNPWFEFINAWFMFTNNILCITFHCSLNLLVYCEFDASLLVNVSWTSTISIICNNKIFNWLYFLSVIFHFRILKTSVSLTFLSFVWFVSLFLTARMFEFIRLKLWMGLVIMLCLLIFWLVNFPSIKD